MIFFFFSAARLGNRTFQLGWKQGIEARLGADEERYVSVVVSWDRYISRSTCSFDTWDLQFYHTIYSSHFVYNFLYPVFSDLKAQRGLILIRFFCARIRSVSCCVVVARDLADCLACLHTRHMWTGETNALSLIIDVIFHVNNWHDSI